MNCEEENTSELQSEQAGGEGRTRQSGEGGSATNRHVIATRSGTLKNHKCSIGWKDHLLAHWWIVADDLLFA